MSANCLAYNLDIPGSKVSEDVSLPLLFISDSETVVRGALGLRQYNYRDLPLVL